MNSEKAPGGFFQKLARFIVDKRYLIFLLYAFALVFCLFSMNWVNVENDVTTYLPEDTETRQGLTAMNENFSTFAMAQVMVSNITYEDAVSIRDQLAEVEGVELVGFDDSPDHYTDASALYDLNFSASEDDPVVLAAMDTVAQLLDRWDVSYDTTIGYDEISELDHEMGSILMVAVVIIILVLTLTSRSYAEVPVLLLTFGAAALLNMGTNFLCGKISFISDSIAVVLQLALAIDYAIILCHRFSDEHETKDVRTACIDALAKSIPEISASSLTTISGLAALSFMKFSIGLDMSVVLIKSVLLSMLSVFTLMPGLLMLFSPLIDKTQHKKLLPNITPVGRFAVAMRFVMPVLFTFVLVGAFLLSSHCPFCYSYNNVETAKMSERQVAHFEIMDEFGSTNMVALVVPSGDYDAEKELLQRLEARPEVKSTMALSSMEALDGYMLTDSLTPRQFSELIGLDYEVARALYTAYAIEQDQYGQFLSGLSDYKVPLFDIFVFLKEEMQTHHVTLSGDARETMDELFAQLDSARAQMLSDDYHRMVVFLNLPEESPETFAFLDEMRSILGEYYTDDYYVVGNSTSSRDLASSFAGDNLLISILSALFVILVLLFTFQSVALPVLLILVIQGSIWINFSIPTIQQVPLYFLGYLIVNAIQMGANIDYAIVISSHYQELKTRMPHKQAIVQALNSSFPTIFTSGSIMAAAGLLIGNMSAQPVIAIMGNCLGRGTIISIVMVLGVLPAILVLGDTIIEKTSFRLKSIERRAHTAASGSMRVKGHVRGYISGMVDADFSGTLNGDLNAAVSTGSILCTPEADSTPPDEGQPVLPENAETEGGQNHEE